MPARLRPRACSRGRLSASIVALTLLATGTGHAQEILLTGPLKGAPAGRLRWRARRVEIGAVPGIRLGKAAPAAALWGAQIRYYPWDRLAVGGWAAGATALDGTGSTLPAVAGPELVAAPLAGKLRFLDYVPYDVHALAGAAWVRAASADELRLAPTFGVGLNLFSASWLSTSFDYRLAASSPLVHWVTVSVSWWPLERRWSDE